MRRLRTPFASGRRRHVTGAIPAIIATLESRTLLSASAFVVPITATTVDPPDGLRLSTNDEKPSAVLGEGSTFSTWAAGGTSSAAVSATGITAVGKTAGTPVTLTRTAFTSNATTLEYGWYDYVQLGLQLPASSTAYASPVTLSYGTSNTVPTSQAGVGSAARSFTIPAAQLAIDGGYHVYRINVGKLAWWEGNLTDFQVSIPTVKVGQVDSLKYLEVGDLPNSTLPASPTTPVSSGGYLQTDNSGVSTSDSTFHSVQSKHFVYYYDTAFNPGGQDQTVAAHNALEILEQSQRVYTQVLGFRDVFGWAQGLNGDTTRYKLNVTDWYGGYFSGGYWLNVDTSGSETLNINGYPVTEAPGSPIAHEFGHVTDSQNGSWLADGHWESHADWYREQWSEWYAPVFNAEGMGASAFNPVALEYSNLQQDNKRQIYSDWRVYTPLQYYAASMGLDANLASELWSQGPTDLTVYDKLASLLPANVSVKDVAAQMMQYWPMLDFPTHDGLAGSALGNTAESMANFYYETRTFLEPDADKPGWYAVPYYYAPAKYAYNNVVLTPTAGSTSVSVTLQGLPSLDPTADWRYVLEDVSGYGTASAKVLKYSPVFANNATGTISLASSSDTVLLVVTATPGNTTLDLNGDANTARPTQAPLHYTYPYEVSVSGATPATGVAARIAYPRSGTGAYWTNPDGSAGGWVDSTASVAAGAYIAPGAEVLGYATIGAGVKLKDYAVVADSATVTGNVIVSGYAVVNSNARVGGNARVEDHAMVGTNATVSGNAVIEQDANVGADYGTPSLTDNSVARGVANQPYGALSGWAIVDHDSAGYTESSGVHEGNHPYDGDFAEYYDDNLVTPPGLIASYRANETTGNLLFDEFGTLNAQLRGTPTRVNDSTLNSQVLSLDGSTQYAVLDRSLADLTDGTYSFVVNPAAANQPLLYFGSSANTYLKLVARDANGKAQLTISVNGTVETLESTAPVPLNAWTNLALTFSGGTATFYVNGVAAGTTGSTGPRFRPTDVLTSDDHSIAEPLFLGRDAAGNLFRGKVDDVRFYSMALTPAQIVGEIQRSGAVLGSLYRTTPGTFDGTSTMAQSGVHDQLVATISASINPTASPNEGNYYAPIVDSTDERYVPPSDGKGTDIVNGSGLGLNNGYFYAKLDGYGMWNTGVPVTLNAWSQVTLTFDGSTAKFYVNGVLRATQSYSATGADVVGKTYRVGYGQTGSNDPSTRTYFAGQILDLTISDRVVAPATALPPGMTTAGINSPSTGGSATTANGASSYLLTGAGAGIGGTSDQFQYTYVTTSGTGQLNALISSPAAVSGTLNAAATAGLMYRASTAAGSVFVSLSVTPSSGLILQYRKSTNGLASQVIKAGISGPVYLRLVRSSSTVAAYYSTDGTSFTQVGSTITLSNLPTAALAGMAVSSRNTSNAVQSTATSLSITSASGPSLSTAAAASASAVSGTTVNLSVLGADPSGESGLTYTWQQTTASAAPVLYSANGTNAAKNTTVTFRAAGTYTFLASITDASGQVVRSGTVTVTVSRGVASLTASATTVTGDGVVQFTAVDQFGAALTPTWSTTKGTITATGLFTAPATGVSSATITAFSGGSTLTNTVAILAPIAWYQMDSIAVGSTAVADSSGNGNAGTLSSSAPADVASVAGEVGNALSLQTDGTYVSVPASAVKSLTSFTIAAWVYLPSNPRNWVRLFDFSDGTTNKYMEMTPDAGDGFVRFAITGSGGGGEQQVTTTTALSANRWYHLAVTLGGGTATVYVNGVAVGTNTNVSLTPADLGITTAYIGKSIYNDPGLVAYVDDFRIYGAAASPATIANWYSTGLAYAQHVPTLATAASATPPSGGTSTLSALGRESAGEPNLTYTWVATVIPSGATATFSQNGNNAAKSTVVTFSKTGTYKFLVTIADPLGYSVTSTVSITVTSLS